MSCCPVAALPNVAFPTISVTGELPGTDPQTMASSVATPLEKQFGQIPYLTQMTSTSSLGYTNITLQFALNDNISSAATLVQAAINAAAGQLPKDMFTQPTYHETNPADAPILVLGLTSDTLPITTVDDYAESILEQKLSQVPGVGLVSVGGEQHPSVRIQFNPAQLAANGLDLEDVRTALTNVSVDQPKGTLYGQARAFTLQTNDQILKPQDWNNQIIAWRNGGPIRVSDVGQAAVGPQDITLKGWVNLHRGIILAIERLPGANVIQTVEAVKAALPQLQASIPSAIKISVISDRTTTIRASVADVQFTLMLTIGLVVMVIFLFLRSVWPTVIPAIAVPVSIVGTFGGHVRVRLQFGQFVADGTVDCGGLRRRRRDRDGREHRPAYRDGQEADAGRPGWGGRDRFHHSLDLHFIGGGVHSAAADGRHGWPHVSGVCGDRDGRHRGFRAGLADADADDGRAAVAAGAP